MDFIGSDYIQIFFSPTTLDFLHFGKKKYGDSKPMILHIRHISKIMKRIFVQSNYSCDFAMFWYKT